MQTEPGQHQAGDNNRQLGIADLNMETVLSGDNLLVVFQPLGVFNPRIGHATSSERATREKDSPREPRKFWEDFTDRANPVYSSPMSSCHTAGFAAI